MLHPAVFNTSQVCYQLGVRHAVLSPGSRNAPLIISFARNKNIKKWIVPDERSAGFIALGIAQERKEPVVLCCTSGTALLNYAPAIAEACYRQIPLIVLSADRPAALIDQRDGQTIRQFEVLKNHVKRSIQLPVVTSPKEATNYQTFLVDGIRESMLLPRGPVHLNIPFREPFYPSDKSVLTFGEVELSENFETPTTEEFQIPKAKKILLLVGQAEPNRETRELIKHVGEKLPVIKFPLNNLQTGIELVDGFIDNQYHLVPELLITSGLSVLSKKLKTFLRKHKPKIHLHFDEAGVSVDTYQSNPRHIRASLKDCLKKLQIEEVDHRFKELWDQLATASKTAVADFMHTAAYSEARSTFHVLKLIPAHSILHLSNSMPVRYADLFEVNRGVLCRSNRGTSGIDGCTSTAIGNALVSVKTNFLISGDLAFLYDRNAFFHNYCVPNLKVIIMNNQGGGIFRLISGPSGLPELAEYFETRHNRTAEYICAENNHKYFAVKSDEELSNQWKDFVGKADNVSVMEIFSDPEVNQKVYKNLRKHINEQINGLEKSS